MTKEVIWKNNQIRAALDRHRAASDANDIEEEHEIYREDAVLEYPQSVSASAGRRKISRLARRPTSNASRCGGSSARVAFWVTGICPGL